MHGANRFAFLLALTALAAAVPAAPAADAGAEDDWAAMRPITPRGYVCARTSQPLVIDGRADEPAWAGARWTDDFVDIEGDRRPGAITRRNAVIFHDNDFEVFIDPDGDHHNYYEFEVNPLNTVWELSLDKPYRDGGPARDPANVEGLRSEVHVDGTLNQPGDTDRSWSVELAIPWKGLAKYAGRRDCPPKDGQQWRVNFSRVEWLVDIIDGKYRKIPKEMRPEDNWVWSPQGVVDMHRPERWGFVQFSTSAETATFRPDPTLAARDALMNVYYRQRAFQKRTGHYARSAGELGLSDKAEDIKLVAKDAGYTATTKVTVPGGGVRELRVREDSKLWEQGDDAAGRD
jgi:hypothetical protein